ncbi:hypothetical protein M1D97_12410 [Kushneria sp. AK178]
MTRFTRFAAAPSGMVCGSGRAHGHSGGDGLWHNPAFLTRLIRAPDSIEQGGIDARSFD